MNRIEAAQYALDALKKAGAGMASAAASEGHTDEFNFNTGKFSLYRTLFNSGLSIKAIKDGKKGIANTSSLEKNDIDDAIADCIAAANEGTPDPAEGIAEKIENKKFEAGVLNQDKDSLFDRMEEFVGEVKEKYPNLSIRQFIAEYVRRDTVYLNTNGVEFESVSGNYDYRTMVSAQDGEKTTSFTGSGASFLDPKKKFLDMGLMRVTIEDTLKSLDPKPVEGKFVGPIILTPSCLMNFLTMTGMNFIGEGGLIDGTSIWKDKLNQTVAHPSLSFSLNPYDSRIVCGERFTADGFESKDMEVIKNGVLKNFQLSLYGANKTGKPRSPNSSGSMVVAGGDKSLENIIGGIDNGLLVSRFSGGMPGRNGDFSGVAKNSFAIRDGKVTNAVKETMISGNLEKLFQSIIAISSEIICNGTSVLPWMALDGVTISGK
ncbi:MAG: TldD/PmbA family protein [Treponema sp.]|nr:TldD/PmbA family protein [Treponema sp.]